LPETTPNSLLSGLRVLDLTRLLPGPFCTLYLAQLGASVLKVEDPGGGDYVRALSPEVFAQVNRNKRSLTLDLRKPQGVQVFQRLVQRCDVVVESFRPGVMTKLGCDYETLKTLNPRLVYASLTGYGQTGPYRERAGHDMNYAAYAGALDQSDHGRAPVLPNTLQADLAGGALTCAIGVLSAVLGARASGRGCYVDCAMLDGILALQVPNLASLRMGYRGPGALTGALPNYQVYECADGKYVALGALEPKFWKTFCEAAGHPELADPAVQQPLEQTKRATAALFKTKTRDEWEAQLAHVDACANGIYSLEEALNNEQIRARGLVELQDGKPMIAQPLRFVDAAPVASAPAPELGADTREILEELGIDDTEYTALKTAGAC